MRWNEAIGLRGVDPHENERAKFCSQVLEWPMLVATLWIIALWYLSNSSPLYTLKPIHDLALWSLFIFETLVLSVLVDDTKRYLRGNWVNLAIILFGIPILWGATSYIYALRILRVLTLVSLIVHVISSLQKLMSRNSLGPILLSAAIVVVMAGTMIATIDPGIKTAGDGIWWAWVTVTTVGYGDVVPVTPLGRFFGGILILIGIGLFAALTASFATLFMSNAEKDQQIEIRKTLYKVDSIHRRLARLEQKLDALLVEKESAARKSAEKDPIDKEKPTAKAAKDSKVSIDPR